MTNARLVTNMRKKSRQRKSRKIRRRRPTIRFTPYSWSKLLYLRDAGDTEVGGFGISDAEDLLLVNDVQLVDQECTAVTVEFDDASVADFFDAQVDVGRQPEQFGRIWIHTHPGDSAEPSGTDEETFERCFGTADWVIMFILAAGGATYARLQFNVGPRGRQQLNVEVDYSEPFAAADTDAWDDEYDRHVLALDPFQGCRLKRVANLFDEKPSEFHDDFEPAFADALQEWYARADAIDLFPETELEDPCNNYLAAAD